MKIISFDGNTSIKRDSTQDNLFDLFQKNIVNIKNIPMSIYIVPREYEMRLDRISEHIYGTTDYIEELMVINDIINPYSIKEGQYIYFCDSSNFNNLYTTDDMTSDKNTNRQTLINSSQPNRNKTNLSGDQNLPLTIKPSTLKQVKVNKDNLIQIMNSFE